jgi:hypothetical protein
VADSSATADGGATLPQREHEKYESLLARRKSPSPAPYAVAHPCDETSQRAIGRHESAPHSKNRRLDAPQVVVGLAITRDGFPVRDWVFAGNTVNVGTT